MSTRDRRPLYEIEAGKKYAAKRKRASAKTVRKATQAQRRATRSPGGMKVGGPVPLPKTGAVLEPYKGSSPSHTNLPSRHDLQKAKRTGAQAQRKASRSPGGYAEGRTVESYSAQVQRKYGGGKV